MAIYMLPPQDVATLYTELKSHHLNQISNEDLGRITRAEHTAFNYCRGKKRRNGDDAITHLLSMAVRSMQMNWPPVVNVNVWLHDSREDSDISLEILTQYFGWKVATTVSALSRLPKGISSASYYQRMTEETLKVRADDVLLWMIPMVKLLDRADFCLRTYPLVKGKTIEDEARKLNETIGPFSQMYKTCRPVIPAEYQGDCDMLYCEIHGHAGARLDQIYPC